MLAATITEVYTTSSASGAPIAHGVATSAVADAAGRFPYTDRTGPKGFTPERAVCGAPTG